MAKIYLNKMEFPFTFISEVINKYTHNTHSNKYPSQKETISAKKKLLRLLSLTTLTHNNLILGNGSDELISLLIATTHHHYQIGFFKPTFTMYKKYCKSYNKKFIEINLNNFKLNTTTLHQIKYCKLFFICNPNNPNGNSFSKQQLIQLITAYPQTYFIVDEAYTYYSKISLVNYISTHPNLIILQTLSKIGFAGSRVGIMLSNTNLITHYNKHKSPYNLGNNQLEILNKVATSNLYKLIQIGINRIQHTKQLVTQKIQLIKTINLLKSKSNFILITKKTGQLLPYKNIEVKPLILNTQSYQRISIGKTQEMLVFLKMLFRNEKRILFRKKNLRK
ncbi:aminotransferase class I/II-fold pyridoxal phosphate-dependent enzyme [Candidatus Vidania fulgoroideae]|nr:aminotransferase class I/II-fold pyridoxal phosphate-dependent enzyme [Candidatus Vidania fulgoroideae]